jgi:hypothetical protein
LLTILIIKKEVEMFKKFLFISLICIGVVALVGTQASAGCKNFPPRICADWIRGTTDLKVTATGLGRLECAKDPTATDCPYFSAAIYGRVDPGDGSCDPTTLDEDCLIAVTAVCGPKKCLKNPHYPGCQNMDLNSSHFTFADIGGISFDAFNECRNNGRCTGLKTFLADVGDEVCRPGHVLIDALATDFNGDVGFYLEGVIFVGSVTEHCQIDPATAEPGDSYSCVSLY